MLIFLLFFGKWEYLSLECLPNLLKFIIIQINGHSVPTVYSPGILYHWTNTAWLPALSQAYVRPWGNRDEQKQLSAFKDLTVSDHIMLSIRTTLLSYLCPIFWFYRSPRASSQQGKWCWMGERRKETFAARLFPAGQHLTDIKEIGAQS